MGAPEPLRAKARAYLESEGRTVERTGTPELLAVAAWAALAAVLAHPGDRSIALDLLAADALVTLALKARAQEDPAKLARFAAELLA